MKRQSSLLPYKNEIVTLRRQSPPVSYAEISGYLREKYQITVNREAIFKFIKACATAHKRDKNKSCKPCTYAHKIKLGELVSVKPDSKPIAVIKSEPGLLPNKIKAEVEEEIRQRKEIARYNPENLIIADPNGLLPDDLVDKLFDMGCGYNTRKQYYHVDMVVVAQARQLVKKYLNPK